MAKERGALLPTEEQESEKGDIDRPWMLDTCMNVPWRVAYRSAPP